MPRLVGLKALRSARGRDDEVLGVSNEELRLEVELAPGGSPVVKVFDIGHRLLGQYRVTPKGELVRVVPQLNQ